MIEPMRFGSTSYEDNQRRLVINDKYSTYALVNPRGVEYAALDLVAQRLSEGWYYNWDDGNEKHQYEDRAEDIVEREWAIGALNFLKERDDHEYEGIEVVGG